MGRSIPSYERQSMYRKIRRYTGALKHWVRQGRPVRSPQQIEAIFNGICLECDAYDDRSRACRVCGCFVSKRDNPLANKIAMKTEHCPLQKW